MLAAPLYYTTRLGIPENRDVDIYLRDNLKLAQYQSNTIKCPLIRYFSSRRHVRFWRRTRVGSSHMKLGWGFMVG